MELRPVECQKCHKIAEEGDVLFSANGAYIDRIVGPWYWSDNDECWYCKPCEGELVSEGLAKILGICKSKNIPVMDFDGNRIA